MWHPEFLHTACFSQTPQSSFASFSGVPNDFLRMQCMLRTQCGGVHGSFSEVSKRNGFFVWVYATGKQRNNNGPVTKYGVIVCLNSFQSGIVSVLKPERDKCCICSVLEAQRIYQLVPTGSLSENNAQYKCHCVNHILSPLCLHRCLISSISLTYLCGIAMLYYYT